MRCSRQRAPNASAKPPNDTSHWAATSGDERTPSAFSGAYGKSTRIEVEVEDVEDEEEDEEEVEVKVEVGVEVGVDLEWESGSGDEKEREVRGRHKNWR